MFNMEELKSVSNITLMRLIENRLADLDDLRFEPDEDSIWLFNESIKNLEMLRTELFKRWSEKE